MQQYDWSILDKDRTLINNVTNEWTELLNNKALKEEDYHQYLARHAGLFFSFGVNRLVVISKLRFGADYVADFVVPFDNGSYGFGYNIIELESPHANIYTSKGNPSARLTAAIQQILNWKSWVESNRTEAQKLFPSVQFKVYNNPNIIYTVVIGTRENSAQYLDKRDILTRQTDIKIRSFDSFTDKIKQRPFFTYTCLCSAQENNLAVDVRVQLANPFFSAYSDSDWRHIVKSRDFRYSHMVAQNADLLLQKRKYSAVYDEFLTNYGQLSPKSNSTDL